MAIEYLKKSEDIRHLYHNVPPELRDHPLFSGKTTVGMITADAPKFTGHPGGNQALEHQLQTQNLKYEPTQGSYGGPENSFIVHGPTREQMYRLGHQFGQESILYAQDGHQELLYTHGPNAGKFHRNLPTMNFHPTEHPDDYYTHIPGKGFLTLHFDFDKLHESPVKYTLPAAESPAFKKAAIHMFIAEELKKAMAGTVGSPKKSAHPHSYPWHEGNTALHEKTIGHGILLTGDQYQKLFMLAKKEELAPTPSEPKFLPGQEHATNDQSIGKGAPLYHRYAAAYGQVNPGKASSLKYYPMHGVGAAVDKLVADNGYKVHYAGGKHGKADLANKNYNTGHLMIWDPSAGSGSDFGETEYTDNWRKTHELAHAMTYGDLNNIYGEGRRMGALGKQRSTREAMRAVHWEWLAAHKQRHLASQIGINIPDEDFNRELNTVMHDAVHRAVTGKFTEPSEEGFVPHAHKVPLEHALNMVREAAQERGLADDHAKFTAPMNKALAKNLAMAWQALVKKYPA